MPTSSRLRILATNTRFRASWGQVELPGLFLARRPSDMLWRAHSGLALTNQFLAAKDKTNLTPRFRPMRLVSPSIFASLCW